MRDLAAHGVHVYSRALLRAVELLGGRDKLAKVLRVPEDEIERWIGGDAKPPREVFLRVVDVILDETGAGDGANGAPDSPPRDAAAHRSAISTSGALRPRAAGSRRS